ncbi:MAG TPA: PadR family transcriptional regulator [Candidatus Limnocylindrales bacterium]|nr:PadR family transcriptional regulator [Candidatus Limnocylindrales bacterium]
MALTRTATQILLALGEGERHGYAIMRDVGEATGGTVKLGPGTLYTTLARLETDGLIEESDARPDPSLDDQRRRYWRLTPAGRAVAIEEVRRLAVMVERARPWALGEEQS